MKRPAVFFDRDNTLIACDEYLGDPAKVVLIAGASDAVARARHLGYATVVVSNQSGVARGYFSEEAVHAVNQRLDEMLRDDNAKAVIDRHEFCPFHPDASIEKYRKESPMRKPAPGMITSAADALALDLSRSWLIGDAPRDIEAGHAAGCRTILFSDPGLKSSPAARVDRKVEPDYICSTLKEALDFIARNTEGAPADEPPAAPSPQRGEGLTSMSSVEPGEGRDATTPISVPSPIAPTPDRDGAPTEAPALAPHPNPLPSGERGPESASPPPAPAVSSPVGSTAKLESIATEILHELRRRHEQPHADFSVSKLLAGVVQVIVLAVLFMAFLQRSDNASLIALLLFALTLQAMTIAMLIMGRQR
jgi:D-glycero-D-manno-heptose 1,7-bisphosphate phosphatase